MAVYTEPVFEEPKLLSKQGKYERVLTPLMETPNQWGKIGEYKTNDSAYQAALNLRHGRYKIPGSPEVWEFTSDEAKVYARYLEEPPKVTKPVKKATSKARTKK
jgi:hypothetical protein